MIYADEWLERCMTTVLYRLSIRKKIPLCRNPIHDPGALLKAASDAGHLHWYRLIFQAGEVRYGKKTD
jgi:hypothetical protein